MGAFNGEVATVIAQMLSGRHAFDLIKLNDDFDTMPLEGGKATPR
jgi:hypothetical protein